ncbi:MAG: 2-keto-3-deoxygluconate permease [Lactobacillaceae bacterium]|jgi:2-keto-3-deoxygluconate permease|nr:2-keto-3-deoxygluconate permease [Lactobacillaceae bacterium]
MKIKQRIEKIPGGMMIVPLFIGTIVRTFYPNPTVPAEFLPGFTGNYLTGTSVILFVFFFCVGTTINLKSSGYIARKGLSLLISKVILAGLLGVLINHLLPTEGITSGLFAGLSALAVIASFNETNGGLYMALMTTLGREEDAAGFPFISIESGPFMTMITMGIAGMAQFPLTALISTLIPFGLGITLGSLDHDFRKFFGPAVPVLIPFFAFTLGFSINLSAIVKSGLIGILMGVMVVLISGSVLAVVDRFVTGSDGVAGWAASSTAGAAVAVPTIIADMAPKFQPIAENATAIVATSVLVTSILTPLVTMYFEKRARAKGWPIVPGKH